MWGSAFACVRVCVCVCVFAQAYLIALWDKWLHLSTGVLYDYIFIEMQR